MLIIKKNRRRSYTGRYTGRWVQIYKLYHIILYLISKDLRTDKKNDFKIFIWKFLIWRFQVDDMRTCTCLICKGKHSQSFKQCLVCWDEIRSE